MKAKEAIIEVLREAEEPLGVDEITERILNKGLWKTKSKTPDQSISSCITSDIKNKADKSPFVRHAPKTYGLRPPTKPADVTQPKTPPAQISKTQDKYSFANSAEKALDQFGEKQPMHYREVTAKAIEMGWLVTEGRTPEATMYAQILTEIKRCNRRGKQPRFVRYAKGLVGLSKWTKQGLALEIEQHNEKVRKALHNRLLETEWDAFEELIARLLAEMGFDEIEVTSRSKDGGIDVRGTLVVGDVIHTRMAIQVKKWKRNVQAPVVQQVRGSLGNHEQGLIITTSDFSAGARNEAARPDATPVNLMGGKQLVLLLIENGIGVSRRSHELFELEEFSSTDAETNAGAPIEKLNSIQSPKGPIE